MGRGVLETTNEEIKKFVAINFLISGDFLATRPKIKPDGKSYYVRGDVAKVFKNDTMLLEISEHTFGFYGNINKKTSYMFVTMPKKMWTIFENKASIGSEVSLVGRYVSNEDSSGKLVPVLVGEIIAF